MTQNVKLSQAEREAAKIAAMQAAAKRDAELLAQREDVRGGVFEAAGRYGREASAGDMSLTKLCFLYNQATRDGHMTPGDASQIYAAYAGSYNAEQDENGFVTIGNVSYPTRGDGLLVDEKASEEAHDIARKKHNAEKTAASIIRTFAKDHVVAQGLGFFDRVRMLRDKITPENRTQSSMFNAWVSVNRMVSARELSEVSDSDILGEIERSAAAAKKTALEKLTRLVADAAKLAKQAPEFAGLDKVASVLGQIEAAAKIGIKMEVTGGANIVPVSTLEKAA